MSNILIVPWPELGHILPTLEVARYLASKGHRVVYLTAPHFTSQIESVGGEICSLIPVDCSADGLSGDSIWYRFIVNYGSSTGISRLLQLLDSATERHDYSLVLCDQLLGRHYHNAIISRMNCDRTMFFSTALFNWREYTSNEWHVPTIVFCPELFELEKFKICDTGVFHVEPSLRSVENVSGYSDLFASEKPVILATFGSQTARYRHLEECLLNIRALAHCEPGLHFVVATGSDKAAQRILPLPNLDIRRTVPQRLLLKRATAMITHGGLGSIKEAIYEGVPLIVLPMLHDQPYNAMRVRHHGIGEAIFPERRSLEHLQIAIRDAVAGRYGSAIKAMQSVFIAMERDPISRRLIDSRLSNRLVW